MSVTGILNLVASRKRNKTIIANCYYEGALKVTRPVYIEEKSPTIYLIHVGGGYVDGDYYSNNLVLEEGAEMSVTTQSYTKVYKTPNRPVIQETMISLKGNSVLEYIPDPLIAYEGARFIQNTVVHMEEDSSLFYSDITTPGWSKRGAPFQYDFIRSKVKVYKGEKLILFDHLLLEPKTEIGEVMQMEGYTHLGTFLFLHREADRNFGNELYQYVIDFISSGRVGVSTLPETGVIIRMFSTDTGTIEKVFSLAHQYARKRLLKKPLLELRK